MKNIVMPLTEQLSEETRRQLTSNEVKEFVKVFFVASSSLNWIAWGQAMVWWGGLWYSHVGLLLSKYQFWLFLS